MKRTVIIILVILVVFILFLGYIIGFNPALIDVQSGTYTSWFTFGTLVAMCSAMLFLSYELYQKAKIYQGGENPDDENNISKESLFNGINSLIRFGGFVLVALLFLGVLAVAVIPNFGDETAQAFKGNFILFAILGIVVGLLIFAMSVKSWWDRMDPKKVEERKIEVAKVAELEKKTGRGYGTLTWFERFLQIKPTHTDMDVALGHDYDGIEELDNPPPPWFMFLFYFTIGFAVVYFFIYIVGSGVTQEEEYVMELQEAEREHQLYLDTAAFVVDENAVEVLTEESLLAEGKDVYNKNCAVCHKDHGGGDIGPNLTDKYWLHGGDVNSIYKTIKYGVPAKGMQSWKDLGDLEMQKVMSYILTLQGTNPEGAKEPQGDLYEPAPESAAVDSSAVMEADTMVVDSLDAE